MSTGPGAGRPRPPTTRSQPSSTTAPPTLPALADLLRLTTDRWLSGRDAYPTRGLITVVSAWALLAWARFGPQVIEGPRAALRFLLVGVYVWLAMAAVVWSVGRLAERLGRRGPRPDPTRSLQFTGLAHQPAVILGLAVQIGALIPVQTPFTILAVATLLLWLPAQLVVAMTAAFGRLDRWSLAAAVAAYGSATALAGRYLLDRVGHLF